MIINVIYYLLLFPLIDFSLSFSLNYANIEWNVFRLSRNDNNALFLALNFVH